MKDGRVSSQKEKNDQTLHETTVFVSSMRFRVLCLLCKARTPLAALLASIKTPYPVSFYQNDNCLATLVALRIVVSRNF